MADVFFIYSDYNKEMERFGSFDSKEKAEYALTLLPTVSPKTPLESFYIVDDEHLGLVAENRVYGAEGNLPVSNKMIEESKKMKNIELIKVIGAPMARRIHAELVETEYENTIDGEWARDTGTSFPEAEAFRAMSEGEKQAYAMNHAIEYATDLINDTQETINCYGNNHFFDIFNINLEEELEAYRAKRDAKSIAERLKGVEDILEGLNTSHRVGVDFLEGKADSRDEWGRQLTYTDQTGKALEILRGIQKDLI